MTFLLNIQNEEIVEKILNKAEKEGYDDVQEFLETILIDYFEEE